MTQVWVVRYDTGLYVLSSLDAVESSVKRLYPGLEVERQEMSDQHCRFLVMQRGRPQDTISANLFDVHDEWAVIHRAVIHPTESYDEPQPERKEF